MTQTGILDTNETNRIEQTNFGHLVTDIAWFGLALAATSRFLTVYAIRLGATSEQLAILAALPGAVLVIATGFAGWWRRRHSDSVHAVALPGIGFRLVFLLPAFAPWFPSDWQAVWLIIAASLPAIPQGIAGAVFVNLMRESVSQQRMNALLSKRMLALNATLAVGAVSFGLLLENVAFPHNYQLMFVTAFAFTMMSQWHVTRLRVIYPDKPAPVKSDDTLAISPWRSPVFMPIALITVAAHIAFFSMITLTPLHLVSGMGATEGFMAMFGLFELVSGATVALFTNRIIQAVGAKTMMAIAMVGTAAAAMVFATAPVLWMTLFGAAISGASWAAVGVAAYAMLYDRLTPETSARWSPAFQQVIAIGVCVGPLAGNALQQTGLTLAAVMVGCALLRIAASALAYSDVDALWSRFASRTLGGSGGRRRRGWSRRVRRVGVARR